LNAQWKVLAVSDDPPDGDPSKNLNSGVLQTVKRVVAAPMTENFGITLKAGDYFAAYLFTGLSPVTDDTFDVRAVTTPVSGNVEPGALGNATVSIDPVPEPATLSLLLLGLITLGVAVRRSIRE
jgi:hypothetical protein